MSIRFLNKGGSGLSIKPNIFMQETEPEAKEGIWLKDTRQVDKVEVVESFSNGDGKWEKLDNWDTSKSYYYGAYATVEKKIYMFGSMVANTNYAIYDTETLTITHKTGGKDLVSACGTSIGQYIYLFGGMNNKRVAYKYNTENATFSSIADIPVDCSNGFAIAHNSDIYLFFTKSSSHYIYRYNTVLNTYTLITSSFQFELSAGTSAKVGDDIFIFQRTNVAKFNLLTQEVTSLSTSPLSFVNSEAIEQGTDIYIMGGSSEPTTAYKYDTLTDTFTQIGDIPYRFYSGNIGRVGNSIYILGGVDTASGYQCARYVIPVQEFDDKTIAIAQGSGTYKTQMYANENITGRLLYGFDDVQYNTTENGLDDTISTYYGDGTEWIKFKN